MPHLRAVKVLVLAAAALLLVATTSFSTAAFTDSSTSSASVTAAADWSGPKVELRGITTLLQGSVLLTVAASDEETGIASVTLEQRRAGSPTWTPICSRDGSPAMCAWDTSGLDGIYELRARATDSAGNTAVSAVRQVTLDNTAPTVTMHDPGSPLSGTRTFTATAADTSGVTGVVIQYAATGTGTWQDLCTAPAPTTGTAWSCSVDTTALPDGTYDLRAVGTDRAGLTARSLPVTGRTVDNRPVSSVTLADPGTSLRANVPLTASASSTAGIRTVTIQYAPTGSTAWKDICTGTTSTLACGWDTTTVTDGRYDLRAVLVDTAGQTAYSTVLRDRAVSNPVQTGADIQTTNVGWTTGRPEEGDLITFTYGGPVALGSLLPGWTGSGTDVTVRLTDTGRSDTLTVLAGGRLVGLGSVDLQQNHVKKDLDVEATMTAGTTTVNGRQLTTVTIRLGYMHPGTNGSLESAVTAPATMLWTPAGSTVTVSEQGPADVDF